jgi:flagellar motility protein MotE (MotC chaperone)
MAARTTPWFSWPRRLRLLPVLMGLAALLAVTKIERLVWGGQGASPGVVVATAQAQGTPTPTTPAPAPAPALAPTPATAPAPAVPSAEAQAERAVLEALRARRAEIEAREQSAAAREQVVSAAERRLGQRIEELTALQQRLEALERDRAAREEAGMRGLVRLYEGMRPRDAATIFDELEMPVLVRIVDRMREAKASPVIGAMKPERARLLTAELARLRAERVASR